MERRPTPLFTFEEPAPDPDLLEILGAIELVAAGAAGRVLISGLRHPQSLAPEALARAQGAGVAFGLQREGERVPTVVVGPRIGERIGERIRERIGE